MPRLPILITDCRLWGQGKQSVGCLSLEQRERARKQAVATRHAKLECRAAAMQSIHGNETLSTVKASGWPPSCLLHAERNEYATASSPPFRGLGGASNLSLERDTASRTITETSRRFQRMNAPPGQIRTSVEPSRSQVFQCSAHDHVCTK